MKKIIVLLSLVIFIPLFSTPVKASVIFEDNFENGLGNWTKPLSVTTETDTDPGSTHGKILKVNYPGDNTDITVSLNNLSSYNSGKSNLVYEIEFWDDPGRNYGTGFSVQDTGGRYLMIGVNDSYSPGHYFLRNGTQAFDTNVPRTTGWHLFQIYTTEVGTYAAIDHQTLVYLRGHITVPENETNFPINNNLKNASLVFIESPTWGKPASNSYWDNFKIYEFRPQAKTTVEKETDLLVEFLNSYEPFIWNNSTNDWSDEFKNLRQKGHWDQNFELSKLGLAAAYGVRAKKTGNQNDSDKLKRILEEVIDDYNNYGSSPDVVRNTWTKDQTAIPVLNNGDFIHWEPPISGQMIAQIASWQWGDFSDQLKTKVINLVLAIVNNSSAIDFNDPIWREKADDVNSVIGKNINTWSEEMAWNASLLNFAADFMPNNPNSSDWKSKAKNLACQSTSSKTTMNQNKYPCEVYKTLTPDSVNFPGFDNYPFLVINHAMVNPSYALTIPWGFAQATLFDLNKNIPASSLPLEYRKNLDEIYNRGISPLVRFSNYTYKSHPADNLSSSSFIKNTGRDDWGQDATLQDSSWLYLDKVLGLNNHDAIVNYAWLTRGERAEFPVKINFNIDKVLAQTGTAVDNADFNNFFLNSMDAVDRFVSLFMLAPDQYKLNTVTPTPTPTPGDLNSDGKVNIADYNQLMTDFGKIGSPGFIPADINKDGKVDIFDYNILVGSFGK